MSDSRTESRSSAAFGQTKGTFDLYSEITRQITEMLDKGVVPWRSPILGQSKGGYPKNLDSKKPYRGVNVFLLAFTAFAQGFQSAFWLTFKQALAAGGNVKKGEKSTMVVFWKRLEVEDKQTGEKKGVPMIRYYRVFNAEQCEGIKPPDVVEFVPTDFKPIETAEAIIKGYADGPAIEHGGTPEQLRNIAAKGDTVAQRVLGLDYLNGTGVSKDRAEAEKWLRLAADHGDAPSQYALAEMNTKDGAANDEAVKLYRKAADQGYAPAQSAMGEMTMDGETPSRESLDWFQKAAAQGNILAEYHLGCFYKDGRGVRKDATEAVKWFRKAAAQNDSESQEFLAEMYDSGNGVAKDHAEAFKWHKKAAEQGDSIAEWNLAAAYLNGEGVQQNNDEAMKWMRSAAKHGVSKAQDYLRGQGLTW